MNNNTQNPPSTSVSDTNTESQLIDLSLIIGSIAESNSMFTEGLARHIDLIGKPLSDMTLCELAQLANEYRVCFNDGTEPEIERLSVSCTKHKSLKKQHDIIGIGLSIFEISPSYLNKVATRLDIMELVRMLDDIPNSPRGKSLFNVYVLDKAKKLIAERVSFQQALQYENCVIKFACMEVA